VFSSSRNFGQEQKMRMKVSERRSKTFWPNLRRSLQLLPLLCKVEKLEANEHTTLFKSIAEFWDAYVDKSNRSITIKIHMLHDHVEKQLKTYGTIRLFAEDSVKSIHVIVNILAHWYAVLDPERSKIITSNESTCNAEENIDFKAIENERGRERLIK
jgi:hypothetical protein